MITCIDGIAMTLENLGFRARAEGLFYQCFRFFIKHVFGT